ncbi:MAG: TolC family protein [Ignavibacteriaceae bacterium]|nr:TolC family protein [Ignavibacteriaceae bacterium]
MYPVRVLIILTVLTFISPLYAQEPLKSVVMRAIEVSPELKMFENKSQLILSRITSGTNLPDPVLSLGLNNVPVGSFSLSADPMTSKMVGLSQAFPFPGKLKAEEEYIRADIGIIDREKLAFKLKYAYDAAQLYYDYLIAAENVKLYSEMLAIMEKMAETGKAMVTVSESSQYNLIRTETEIERTGAMITEAEGEKYMAAEKLRTLIKVDSLSQISGFGSASLPPVNEIDLNAVAISDTNPVLSASMLSAAKAVKMREVMKYDYLPEFMAGAEYMFRSGMGMDGGSNPDMVSVMVSVMLPLNYGGKTDAKIEETKIMEDMAFNQYRADSLMIASQINSSVAGLQKMIKAYNQYGKGVTAKAELAVESAMGAFGSGTGSFDQVLDALNSLTEIKTAKLKIYKSIIREYLMVKYMAGYFPW